MSAEPEKLTLGQKILVRAAGTAFAVGAALLWWNHEPPPKDPCQDLRDYFAQAHDDQKIENALGQPARIVVIDAPNAENGIPCALELVAE